MANDTRIFSVDKFLGINESADSETELKPGEASRIVNFTITDGGNLAVRPGISRFASDKNIPELQSAFPIWHDGKYWILCESISNAEKHWISVYAVSSDVLHAATITALDSSVDDPNYFPYKVFVHGGKVWTYWINPVYQEPVLSDDPFTMAVSPYLYNPKYISGAPPAGGGEIVEPLNILSDWFRVVFTADGTSKDYVLPSIAASASTDYAAGTYNAQTHTFTFASAPAAQSEVEFICKHNDPGILSARKRFFNMKYSEQYNGATDTRTFFYGDGTNVCYYTGTPAHGSGLYLPIGSELAVDFSASPITAMIRHYSRLLAFKPDGVDAITYEPVTLADGSVTAGFYVRPVSRDQGNVAPGQVVLVNNSARSLSAGNVYDWRLSSGNYRDERYTKLMSEKVFRTLAKANLSNAVACDNDEEKTWYLFLNDSNGTVLIHRYDLDVWSIWESHLTKNVKAAFPFENKTVFLADGHLYFFNADAAYDDPVEADDPKVPIPAVWESGMMSFSAPFRRKYSSHIWLSLLPQSGTNLEMTAETDKSDQYVVKTVKRSLLDFGRINFGDFAFQTVAAPTTNRIKLKVKKFIFYKLIFRISEPGARATILGYDQQIRYSSNVK